jgi:hypothetical protein
MRCLALLGVGTLRSIGISALRANTLGAEPISGNGHQRASGDF